MSLYKINSFPGWYRVVKFDEHLNIEAIYDMPVAGTRVHCSCFQATKPTCRHREMIPIFEVMNRVNTGHFYDYDAKVWHQPIDQGELRYFGEIPL